MRLPLLSDWHSVSCAFIFNWPGFSICLDNFEFYLRNTYFTCAWNLAGVVVVHGNRETPRLLGHILLKTFPPQSLWAWEDIFKYVPACSNDETHGSFSESLHKNSWATWSTYQAKGNKRQRQIFLSHQFMCRKSRRYLMVHLPSILSLSNPQYFFGQRHREEVWAS